MAFERANDAHDEAVDIYREAQSPIADTNVDALSREALDIKDEVSFNECVSTLCILCYSDTTFLLTFYC